jgi:hypothetical protein
MPQTIEQRLVRYNAWRQRRPVARPMLGLIWEPDIPPLPEFSESLGGECEITPENIRPELFLSYVERWHQRAWELPGDVIQRFTPAFGIPWSEAIAGCPVAAHPGSLWAGPCLEDYADRPAIGFDPDNPWLKKLIEFTRAMVEHSAGRYPVAMPQMRGPLDMLAAMRTPEQMCLDLADQPDEVSRLLGELAELWIHIGQTVLETIPSFYGGHSGRMGFWVPGPAITMQNDVSTLLSPAAYRGLVLPWDRKIVEEFPYTEFHTHGSENHQIGNILELEHLTAIELTLEHTIGGPPLEEMLSASRRILDKKPLLLAALDIESAERCLQELPSAGLCILLAVSGSEIPLEFCEWLKNAANSR